MNTKASFVNIIDRLRQGQYVKATISDWSNTSIQFYLDRDNELYCTAGLSETWPCFGRQLADLEADTFTEYELFDFFYSTNPLPI